MNSTNKGRTISVESARTDGWCGVQARILDTAIRVSVVDTVANRYEAGILALGASGRVPAAARYLGRVFETGKTARLDGDVLVVKNTAGELRIVHAGDLHDLRRPHRGSLAAVLGGRPTVAMAAGETSPRVPTLAAGELEAANEALVSGRWGLGPFNVRAAQRFSAVFGIKHVVLTANGSVPLTLAVKALGIGEDDEVLVPATTFQATAGAMYDARVVPTPIDCLPGNLTIDPEALRAHLVRAQAQGLRRPRAVIAVALYSQLPDLRALREICDDYGLKLIFDFAHGPYAEIENEAATRFADIVTYSFQQSKSLSLGEGGAIATDDDELAPVIAMLVSCGYMPWGQLEARIKGGLVLKPNGAGGFILPDAFRAQQSVNFRMAEVQAAQLYARLATFMDTFDTAVENIAALQEVVERFGGLVEPFAAVPDARGPFYKWGFRVNLEWMPADVVRWALRAQLGHEVIFCYPALTLADQRNPLVPGALRGLVNDEYLKAITARHDVPNAERAIDTAALIEWAFLVRENPAAELERALRVLERDAARILARA